MPRHDAPPSTFAPGRTAPTPLHSGARSIRDPTFLATLIFARHFAGAGAGIEGTQSAERGAWNWAGPVQPDRRPVTATGSHLGRPTSGGRARDPKPRLGSDWFDLSLPHSIPILRPPNPVSATQPCRTRRLISIHAVGQASRLSLTAKGNGPDKGILAAGNAHLLLRAGQGGNTKSEVRKKPEIRNRLSLEALSKLRSGAGAPSAKVLRVPTPAEPNCNRGGCRTKAAGAAAPLRHRSAGASPYHDRRFHTRP